VQQVATEVDVSRPMVWRLQQRFAEEGPDGLLRDKTRQPGKPRSAIKGHSDTPTSFSGCSFDVRFMWRILAT
jgi:hypothetical protein